MAGKGLIAEREALLAKREENREGLHRHKLPADKKKVEMEINKRLREINLVLFGPQNEEGLKEAEEKLKLRDQANARATKETAKETTKGKQKKVAKGEDALS